MCCLSIPTPFHRAVGSGESGTTGFWTTTPCQLATSGVVCQGTSVLPTSARMDILSFSKVSQDVKGQPYCFMPYC